MTDAYWESVGFWLDEIRPHMPYRIRPAKSAAAELREAVEIGAYSLTELDATLAFFRYHSGLFQGATPC